MSRPHHRRAKILFIDDDRVLLELGRFSLEHAGYTFLGATTGRDGLRLAREAPPDLIILDYMMPDLSGKEVFQQLLAGDEELRFTPVIMLTARTKNSAEERELLELGLSAYLHKPFGYDELLNVIDNVLVASQIRERNRVLEAEARASFTATIKTLINLLFAKDNYTGEHSNMLVDLAEAVALRCGLSETDAMYVKLGALLHDIGKIGIPEAILNKPARLTPEETTVMRRHVDYGEQALAGVPRMEIVHAIVKNHHEWWN
ncbi:MAG TPA: response regulator, partial [Pyrinomonadaceae bacterium]|nr:response regulator [Pyrinomonadaceae bacterium]